MRQLRTIAVALLAIGLCLSGAATALAKGQDAVVTLDAPLPVDAPAGSTVRIAWSVDIELDEGSLPFNAEGVFVRLVPASGAPVHIVARQDRPGHYVATVEVPTGGLGKVLFGLRGEACSAGGACAPSDEYFRVGSASGGVAAPAADPAVAPAPIAQAPVETSPAIGMTIDPTWLPVVTLAVLGLVVVGLLAFNRRHTSAALPDPRLERAPASRRPLPGLAVTLSRAGPSRRPRARDR